LKLLRKMTAMEARVLHESFTSCGIDALVSPLI